MFFFCVAPGTSIRQEPAEGSMAEPLGPPGGFWMLSIDRSDQPIRDEFGFAPREEKCPNREDLLPPAGFPNPTSRHCGISISIKLLASSCK